MKNFKNTHYFSQKKNAAKSTVNSYMPSASDVYHSPLPISPIYRVIYLLHLMKHGSIIIQNLKLTLEFTNGVVESMGLKMGMACIYHYGTLQDSFPALNSLSSTFSWKAKMG